ncbi:MAG: 3-dehydroquinate synthase [Elusimicrobia bacterium]|nr:3-dehydroquinate synthase [Elusimicrobiota bacterium]
MEERIKTEILALNIKDEKTVKTVFARGIEDLPGIFSGLFDEADRVCVVTEALAGEKIKKNLERLLGPGREQFFYYGLAARDGGKTIAELEKLCLFLLQNNFSRKSLIIAVGGGSVTDLAGFAASIYMRGINWVSVPTTFLGQIDAGLGGKTAVNFGGVKNVLGSFHQPGLTVCDTAFLDSLPRKELLSGAGELLKYAFIGEPPLRETVLTNLDAALKGDRRALFKCVKACAEFKMFVVSKDEKDEDGRREILNFGHTAAHAFEALSKGELPHGEAVAHGLRFALIVSKETGLLPEKEFNKLNSLISGIGLPHPCRACGNFQQFLALVSKDKKARGLANRFLLIKAPGLIEAVENIKPVILKIALERTLRLK